MRKPYLDNLRWATVVLVMVYHVCYLFNGVGVLGGIPGAHSLPLGDALATIVYPWFMVLLFVVAGICARYALQKQPAGQYLKKRAVKLLVPSTLGLFAFQWVTGWLNLKIGGGLGGIPPALRYPVIVVSGIGPLWFIQLLFLFSCLLVLLRKADPADTLWSFCGRANLPVLLLLAAVLYGAAQLLNMPVVIVYRFGIYFAAFLIGYYVLSHGSAQQSLQTACLPLLGASVLAGGVYFIRFYGGDYTAAPCLQSVWANLYAWLAVLALLGLAGRCANRQTPFTTRMAKSGFGLYALHYPVVLAACYLLHNYTALPPAANYILALLAEFALTPLLCAVIKRIPLFRFLVLGIQTPRAAHTKKGANTTA